MTSCVAEFTPPMTIKKLPKFVLGAMLVGVTASTFAVSLGRMRGTAIVGRAFDVTLLARLGSGEQLSDLCLTTEIFFGDNLISPARVSTAITAGGNAGEVVIRVRTTSAVNEPVVTVNVREGCPQRSTRKYVFLAEALTGKEGDLAISRGEVIGSEPVKLPTLDESGRRSGQGAATSAAPSALSSTAGKKPIRDRIGPSKASADRLGGVSARVAAKAALESAGKSSRSRLKLDPLELGAERDPVLRATSEMLTQPSADPQQRASAAALWQALNAQPQDMLRNSERLKMLETDVAKMLAQNRATELAVSDLRVQLAQSHMERFSNWLVYTLAALLFMSWLIAAYLLTRRRTNSLENASPWWRKGPGPHGRAGVDLAPESLAGVTHGPAESGRFGPGSAREQTAPLFGMFSGSNSVPPADRFKTIAPLEAKDRVDFSISLPSMTGMPRIVNAEELFDVQQQADFFVSLGDFNKAIEVLRHHIADNVETSAVAYLDLFDLYHQLGRQVDYEALSDDFSRTFNAQIPGFDSYKAATQGLESYDEALARIVALWPTPEVLEVIEESIFRKPDSKSAVFSLAAYRDLLLLHAIAKKVVERPDPRASAARPAIDKTAPSVYAHTSTQAASAHLQDLPKLHVYGQDEKRVDPTRPPASRHLGLDIDLSFDFTEPHGNLPATISGLSDHEKPASFTHELLEFEVFPDDRKPR